MGQYVTCFTCLQDRARPSSVLSLHTCSLIHGGPCDVMMSCVTILLNSSKAYPRPIGSLSCHSNCCLLMWVGKGRAELVQIRLSWAALSIVTSLPFSAAVAAATSFSSAGSHVPSYAPFHLQTSGNKQLLAALFSLSWNKARLAGCEGKGTAPFRGLGSHLHLGAVPPAQ